jgi:MarR family transcriptional regulator, lower aerobic nicotinate degradation pathway regulator
VKRCHLASREAVESVLRSYELGATQWYVLNCLRAGPTMQRDLVRALAVERATVSGVVTALVRKGLIEQVQDRDDQRRRLLRMTSAGAALWDELPDLTTIRRVAFEGIAANDMTITTEVLRKAAERLEAFVEKEKTI